MVVTVPTITCRHISRTRNQFSNNLHIRTGVRFLVFLWGVQPTHPRTATGVVACRCARARAWGGRAVVGGAAGFGGGRTVPGRDRVPWSDGVVRAWFDGGLVRRNRPHHPERSPRHRDTRAGAERGPQPRRHPRPRVRPHRRGRRRGRGSRAPAARPHPHRAEEHSRRRLHRRPDRRGTHPGEPRPPRRTPGDHQRRRRPPGASGPRRQRTQRRRPQTTLTRGPPPQTRRRLVATQRPAGPRIRGPRERPVRHLGTTKTHRPGRQPRPPHPRANATATPCSTPSTTP